MHIFLVRVVSVHPRIVREHDYILIRNGECIYGSGFVGLGRTDDLYVFNTVSAR
jgi:hypothetical protein